MKSYIDLSGCSPDIVERHKSLLRIPVRVGQHCKDLDIVMKELPDADRERIKTAARELYEKTHSSTEWVVEGLPVGTNLRNLPEGAVLHLEI